MLETAAVKTLLLTPGPLTTTEMTRAALNRDWGARDGDFIELSKRIRRRLTEIAGAADTHTTIPIQGSGTFAVEATLQTLMPRNGRLLVLINGTYGRRMAEITRRLGRSVATITAPENQAIDPMAVDRALTDDAAITDVALVHCETTSGILNPLESIASVVGRHSRRLLVDAMSSFGALPIDGGRTPFTALIASANKCLESVPGVAFVIAEVNYLSQSAGNATSLSLDLYDQWRAFEANGQWRFTPPVQVVAALDKALDQLESEGGVAARGARYRRNYQVLIEEMEALGFEPYLQPELPAFVLATFREPREKWFEFEQFYNFLRNRGVVIYPGKLAAEPSFRIGCIGAIDEADIRYAIAAVAEFTRSVPLARASAG
jgi:2-aminoethylphosphonate-pyruvate transaminase